MPSFAIRSPQSAIVVSPYLEDHFPRLATLDGPDRFVGSLEGKTVRDHRGWIELAGAKEARHLMPGVVHAAADHTVDRDTLEDHLGREVHLHGLGRNPQHLDAAPQTNERERLVNR